jgi:splicing factor 3B subunit 1
MRICFELLDLLKAHKKGIRRAAVNSFGYIAKSLGPQDVLSVLLTNLRVQERQSRVCSTVAIAIVAETCGPFTCIPAILNEYRTAELNVRTGCLKALSFVFEYVGPQSAYYVDSVVTMLEDALTDRDLVHRQTASTIVKHLALGVAGLGCEDSMMHLMNLVWPNCFETSPHVIGAVMEALEAMRVTLGPGVLLSYVMQGLFHPARKVREVSLPPFFFSRLGHSLTARISIRSIGASTMRCTSARQTRSSRSTQIYRSLVRVRSSMTDTRCGCSCKCRRRRTVGGVC